MSFQNQGFWTVKGENDAVLAYDNSDRIEPKRSHQWFIDDSEVDPFPNKKQAVEVPNSNLVVGMLNSDVPSWANASRFHSFSGHFTERLFESEISGSLNFDDRNPSSANTEKLNMERKVNENPLGNDFGLSVSHTLEDPRLGMNFGGFRKVKVCQVKDSDNVLPVTMGHPYSAEDYMSTGHVYDKPDGSSVPMHITYNKGEENFLSVQETLHGRMDNNFMSMEQPYAKGEQSQPISQRYKENSDNLLVDQTFRKGNNSVITIRQMYDKASGNTLLTDHLFNKGEDGIITMGQTLSKDDTSGSSIGRTRNKDESTIISFGGYDGDDANTSERVISSFELLAGHPSVQKSGFLSERELVKSGADALVTAAQIPALRNENICKKEELKSSKKGAANSFPSNVRSLLSTGMLDGVPVKYIAWAREKELHGVIKGSGYLCSCQSCSFSKVINAYEFERHAGCKTKHPNNHIYFENGKTIYGIVQELRSTPQNMLFEVLQTITGSPINQKSFRIWKDSFLAATRELQRIYGKDELKQLS